MNNRGSYGFIFAVICIHFIDTYYDSGYEPLCCLPKKCISLTPTFFKTKNLNYIVFKLHILVVRVVLVAVIIDGAVTRVFWLVVVKQVEWT